MKHIVLFIIGLLYIIATTGILLLVPATVSPLDMGQQAILVMLGIMGYSGGAMYIHISRKNTKP